MKNSYLIIKSFGFLSTRKWKSERGVIEDTDNTIIKKIDYRINR
jgi:hypothetical protein